MSVAGSASLNVQKKIAEAELRSGRPAGSVTLVAVGKTRTAEALVQVLNTGVTHFGENYVQEASKKIDKLKLLAPGKNIHWHLIGALQTNKSKSVVGRFDTVQSVDRIELASAIDARAKEAGLVQNILVQIKLGDEPTKGGVTVTDAPLLFEKISSLKNIRLEGLMSLPPIEAEAEASRKYFSQLRELRLKWAGLISPECGTFSQLSMGTTHDFEVAVEEGATMVRVGTAIFGSREISGLR